MSRICCQDEDPYGCEITTCCSLAERLISGAFAFLLISLFLIAGRAQYFLQPEFQRVRAGVGDHPEGHHRHGPRPVLQQPPAADRAAVLACAGLEQPLTQVRSCRLPSVHRSGQDHNGSHSISQRKVDLVHRNSTLSFSTWLK